MMSAETCLVQVEVADVKRRVTAAKDAEHKAQSIAKQAEHAADVLAEEEPGLVPLLKRAALPANGQELSTLAEQTRHLQAARRKVKVLPCCM